MSGQDLSGARGQVDANPKVQAASVERSGADRRRSLRVELGPGLPVRLSGIGPCRLREVSLGGAMLQIGCKLRSEGRYVLHLDYRGSQVSLPIKVYQNALYELFYDTGVSSRVSFRARVVCCDASIEGLNMLYRIMRDHWSPGEASV